MSGHSPLCGAQSLRGGTINYLLQSEVEGACHTPWSLLYAYIPSLIGYSYCTCFRAIRRYHLCAAVIRPSQACNSTRWVLTSDCASVQRIMDWGFVVDAWTSAMEQVNTAYCALFLRLQISQAPGILRFLDCARLASRSSVFGPVLVGLLVEASMLGAFVMVLDELVSGSLERGPRV